MQRLALEGLVIVGSILLAFALDAWWEARAQAEQTDELVAALIEEFDETAAAFERTELRNSQVIAAADTLLDLIRGASAEVRVDPGILASLVLYPTTDPPRGTVDAVLSSGNLSLIPSQGLRSLLAGWPAALADIGEEEADARSFVHDQLIPHLGQATQLGPVFAVRIERFVSLSSSQSPETSARRPQIQLRVSHELVSLVETRRYLSEAILVNRPPAHAHVENLRSGLREIRE